MTIIDWVAIIGALAWTPHLFSMLKSLFTKSKIRVITERSASIGFTTFGPIFNLGIAFSVSNRDIVVTDLSIRIVHESGEEKLFKWQGITQQVGKMTTPDAGVMPFEKEQSVLAIKLNQKDVEERFIRCQETSFISSKQEYEVKAVKKIAYLQAEDKYDVDTFLREQEMTDLYSFNKHAFSWKEGKYSMVIEVQSPEKFKLFDNRREFLLTHLDIEALSKNRDFLEADYRRILAGLNEDEETVSWQWRSPTLIKT